MGEIIEKVYGVLTIQLEGSKRKKTNILTKKAQRYCLTNKKSPDYRRNRGFSFKGGGYLLSHM